jgi:hypothetical protein
VDGLLAARPQLAQQPLPGGLAVQVGHPLGGDLVTGDDDAHGACLSDVDPAVGSSSGRLGVAGPGRIGNLSQLGSARSPISGQGHPSRRAAAAGPTRAVEAFRSH